MGPLNNTVFMSRMLIRLSWLLLPLYRDDHEYSLAYMVVRKKEGKSCHWEIQQSGP